MNHKEKQSTKSCPVCGNTQLLLWSTLNLKACTDCHIDIPWYKEEGQTAFYCCKPNTEVTYCAAPKDVKIF